MPTPQEFARGIGRALDEQDQQAATALIGQFAAAYPNEFRTFLPFMQREVMRRKQ